MASILFVEDNLELIDEVAELIQLDRPDVQTKFAVDIPTALEKMDMQAFNLAVLDIMLPAWPGVPAQEEGIYLAAWILGKLDELPPGLKDRKPKEWLTKTRPTVIFLTSRTAAPVLEKWHELAGSKYEPLIIERLRDDAYTHCQTILDHLQRVSHGQEETT